MKRTFLWVIILMLLGVGVGYAGDYTDSAHGNTTYGVDRSTIDGTNPFPDYAAGNCAHCHEQHGSVGGIPTTPSKYVLFYDNYVIQIDAFCLKCHDNTLTYAATAIGNRSYSYRAGEWTADSLDDILEAFTSPSPSVSSHNLANIRTFISDGSRSAWGYNADSNPCVGCHNPHSVQGDPENDSSSAKSSASRGWPVSRPSEHGDLYPWNIWGDQKTGETTERMSNYTSYYQAPYRFGGVANGYEPDGSLTTDGSNLTDYVTFCQDCHSSSMTSFSLDNTPIDWNTTGGEAGGDKHGKNIATQDGGGGYVDLVEPYLSAWGSTNGLVLACTDCHEPHGAPNVMLIRGAVNGGAVSGITSMSTSAWVNLCARCHDISLGAVSRNIHHDNTGAPYLGPPFQCAKCHGVGGTPPIPCYNCHYHGADDSWVAAQGSSAVSGRRTF